MTMITLPAPEPPNPATPVLVKMIVNPEETRISPALHLRLDLKIHQVRFKLNEVWEPQGSIYIWFQH